MAVLDDGQYCEHFNESDDEVCSACGRVRPGRSDPWFAARLRKWFSDFLQWARVPH